MHCKGVRGRAKTKSVRFPSDNPLTSLNKPFKDYHASSSSDRNSFGPDQRRSSGSGGEKPRAIKCKFYKSIGDESSVERREFEIWNGSLSQIDYLKIPDIILSHERPDLKNL